MTSKIQYIARLFIFLMLVTYTTTPLIADAEEHSSKIAISNISRIIYEAEAIKILTKEIDTYRKKAQETIIEREKKLKEKENELLSKRAALSPEAFLQEETAFKNEVLILQKDAQALVEKISQEYNKKMQSVTKVIQRITDKISSERGYDIVLPGDKVVYINPKTVDDISDEILTRLNDTVPTLTVDLE